MPKDFEVSRLLDVYGGLLPKKQRLLTELYYNDDLSLSEISENEGITRQGARDAIKRAEQQLRNFEEVLQFSNKISKLRSAAEKGNIESLLKIFNEH